MFPTCRKWANTMFMYMSSSSLPLPMKHKCSPLAMEPDSKDCFCASNRDFTERANSDGFWSICEKTQASIFTPHTFMYAIYTTKQNNLSQGQSLGGRLWTGARRCTAPQADNPPQRNALHPEKQNPLLVTLLKDFPCAEHKLNHFLVNVTRHGPAATGWPAGFLGQTQGDTAPDSGQCPPLSGPQDCYQTDSGSSNRAEMTGFSTFVPQKAFSHSLGSTGHGVCVCALFCILIIVCRILPFLVTKGF